MLRNFKRIFFFFCFIVLGPPLFAQDADRGYCDRGELSAERLVGDWTLHVSPFRISVPGYEGYVGEGGEAPVSIGWADGTFVLQGIPGNHPGAIALAPAGPEEPAWRWSDDPKMTGPADPDSGISSRDLELVFDCEIERFPRYVATWESMSANGYPMDNRIGLIAFDDTLLAGYWIFTVAAFGVQAERVGYIHLTR